MVSSRPSCILIDMQLIPPCQQDSRSHKCCTVLLVQPYNQNQTSGLELTISDKLLAQRFRSRNISLLYFNIYWNGQYRLPFSQGHAYIYYTSSLYQLNRCLYDRWAADEGKVLWWNLNSKHSHKVSSHIQTRQGTKMARKQTFGILCGILD